MNQIENGQFETKTTDVLKKCAVLVLTTVSRGDWLWKPANFKGQNNRGVSDVEQVHHVTLTSTNYVLTLLFFHKFWFKDQDQGIKREQKIIIHQPQSKKRFLVFKANQQPELAVEDITRYQSLPLPWSRGARVELWDKFRGFFWSHLSSSLRTRLAWRHYSFHLPGKFAFLKM